MSMSAIRRAFQEAVGAKGTLIAARMKNEEGGKYQRLEFEVRPSVGLTDLLGESFPARTDLVAAARGMGQAYAATQE